MELHMQPRWNSGSDTSGEVFYIEELIFSVCGQVFMIL